MCCSRSSHSLCYCCTGFCSRLSSFDKSGLLLDLGAEGFGQILEQAGSCLQLKFHLAVWEDKFAALQNSMELSEEQIGQCLKLRLNYLNKLKPLLQHRWEINQTLRQSFGPVLGDSFSGTDLNSARIMASILSHSRIVALSTLSVPKSADSASWL